MDDLIKNPEVLIARYLSGEAEAAETQRLHEWIGQSEANRALYNELERTWNESGKLKALQSVSADKSWDELSHKLFGQQDIQQPRTSRVRILYRVVAAVAAVALLLIVSYWWLGHRTAPKDMLTVIRSSATIVYQVLPDGSEIWLNRNSELRYQVSGRSGERRAVLHGEAFFHVSKDSLHPFIINAADAEVSVLGTSFNVKAYPGCKEVEVMVQSGKVRVSPLKNQNSRLVLSQGEMARIDQFRINPSTAASVEENYLSWKTGKLVFREAPLDSVLVDLEKCYGIRITFAGSDISTYRLTANYDNEKLPEVIILLQTVLGVKFEQTGERDYRVTPD